MSLTTNLTITLTQPKELPQGPIVIRLKGGDEYDFEGPGGKGKKGKGENLIPEWALKLAGLGDSGMAASNAAKTVNDFQKQHNIGLLDVSQLQKMAETGYCTLPNGKTIQVPPEVQAAAQKLMANNGELFKKLESATDGNFDGKLGIGDYKEALKDGSIGKPGTPDRPQQFGLDPSNFMNLVMNGTLSTNRPSEYGAAKTMNDFQKRNDIGLLNIDQVQKMAESGYCPMPGGGNILVSPKVQAAAQKMLENNGELFKKLESATDGKHDGQLGMGDFGEAVQDGTIGAGNGNTTGALPSGYDAMKSMDKFIEGKGLISKEQMQEMATSGTLDGKPVPPDIQASAQKLMENDGKLFDMLESGRNGNHDGKLGSTDFEHRMGREFGAQGFFAPDSIDKDKLDEKFGAATPGTQGAGNGNGNSINIDLSGLGNGQGNSITIDLSQLLSQLGLSTDDGGNGLPSSSNSAKTINDFQNQHNIGLLGVEQMQQMAETGYCKLPNGETIQVPPEVQAAAQKMMDNNGELFKKIESATDGNYDGKLGKGDYSEALKDGTIGAPGTQDTGGTTGALPSGYDAMKSMDKFIEGKGLISKEQMQEMATSGTLDGKPVPPDIQASAQKLMENDGKLFDMLESGRNGNHDGKLGSTDFEHRMGREFGFQGAFAPDSIDKDKLDEKFGAATPGTQGAGNGNGNSINIDLSGLGNGQGNSITIDLSQLLSQLGLSTGDGASGLPSSSDAANTMLGFQREKGIDLMDISQVQQMAETGYCKLPNGETIQVPPEVQAAAQKMMENNGELFKKLESALTGEHDGKLSKTDYYEAQKDGTIDGVLPGGTQAMRSIDKFMDKEGIKTLNKEDVQEMATSGTLNGKPVPPDVQAAAQKLMENDGKLFDILESGKNGNHDGKIGTKDFESRLLREFGPGVHSREEVENKFG